MRLRAHSLYTIRREVFAKNVLALALYVSLWRATGMWYGLPANFLESAAVDPVPMKILLYSIIPLISLYTMLEPMRVMTVLRSTPLLIMVVATASIGSIVVSVDVRASILGLAATIVLAMPALLYRATYGNVDTLRAFSNFAIAAAFINILYTIAFPQFAIMRGSYDGMVKGAFYHKNTLGQFCAISFVCLISTLPRRFLTFSNILRLTAMLCLALLILATRSSTAVVLTALGSAFVFGVKSFHLMPNKAFRTFVVSSVFILFLFAASLLYLGVADVVAKAFGKDLTFSGRTLIWDQLIPLIWDRPLLGYGFAVFRQPEVMAEYVQGTWDARSTHNTYIELALNIGLPGAAAWLAFLITRLLRKLVVAEGSASTLGARRKEFVIILLVMLGALTEAGMMLAPFIVWPHLVAALSGEGMLKPMLRAQRRHAHAFPRASFSRSHYHR